MKEIDWSEPEIKKWLDSMRSESTKLAYRTAYARYFDFTSGLSASQLVDEAEADDNTSATLRKDVIVTRLIAFYKWLKEDCGVKSRVHHEVTVRKGLADSSSLSYVVGMRSFYATNGFSVRMKGKSGLPKPRIVTRRLRVNASQVRTLVENARSLRAKAVILTLFQSGMDDSTLCNLTYGHVSNYIRDNTPAPWRLDLYRPKTGVEYHSFISDDAINAIKVYIRDMESRGASFNNQTRLFLQDKEKRPLRPNLISSMVRDVALRSGLVPSLEKEEINPLKNAWTLLARELLPFLIYLA